VGIGVVWTILFPVGIPLALLLALRRAGIPELAAWKRDCAWLRAIAQRALVLGAKGVPSSDVDTLTTESIELADLRTLHALFVAPPADEHAAAAAAAAAAVAAEAVMHMQEAGMPPPLPLPAAPTAHKPPLLLAAQQQEEAQAVEEQPPAQPRLSSAPPVEQEQLLLTPRASDGGAAPHGSAVARRLSASATVAPVSSSEPTNKPLPRANTVRHRRASVAMSMLRNFALRALYCMRRLRAKLSAAARMSAKSAHRSLSRLMWSGERELLLRQLLDWAAMDETSGVSEPRDHALHWRTQHEWEALRDDGALLGTHDAAERDAFMNLRFLFAGYSVRAWYWCVHVFFLCRKPSISA
jgi:hypothetical protein